jgi:hypothetical protein
MKKILLVPLVLAFASGCVRHVQLPTARSLSGETTLVGCLNTGTAPNWFVLSDSRTGQPTNVMGNAELAMHSGNHAVRLIGLLGTEVGGALKVVKVEHIATSCKAPFPK